MKIKHFLAVASVMATMFAPATALADSNAWGSVNNNGQSATVTVGGKSNSNSNSNSGSTSNNGSHKGGNPGTPGSKTPPSLTEQQLQQALQAGVDIGEYAAQYQAQNGNNPSQNVWTKNFDPGQSVSGTQGIDQHTQWSTSTGSEEIHNVIPLYWDWQFQNKTTGKTLYRNTAPMHSLTETFYDPGHYYVYYHEYDKWETGYYTYVSGTVYVWYNGVEKTQSFSFPTWHSTGWHEGYLTGWQYLLDFSLDDNQVPHTWCVPNCVDQTQLDTSTVQTVAH